MDGRRDPARQVRRELHGPRATHLDELVATLRGPDQLVTRANAGLGGADLTGHRMREDREMGGYSIGEVARLSGVTVRTLHHYDRIGLLCPAGRSTAGHRRYDEADLDRLRQVLFYRELGFALPDIAAMLSGAPADDHLRRQHRLLRRRLHRTEDLLAAVEQEIESKRLGIALTPEQQFAIFGTDRFADLFAETDPAARRRGATYTVGHVFHAGARARHRRSLRRRVRAGGHRRQSVHCGS